MSVFVRVFVFVFVKVALDVRDCREREAVWDFVMEMVPVAVGESVAVLV